MKGSAIFDEFLGTGTSRELLEFAIANEAGFAPSSVTRSTDSGFNPEVRRSSTFGGDWEPLRSRFAAAIEAVTPQLLEATGVPDWSPRRMQIDLAVHRDGDFFRRHIDTVVGENRKDRVRMVSAVYYLCREPHAFSGGELVIFDPLRGGEQTIAPKHDRLVVFASFMPHEVRPIAVPGNAFADARFSVNCWLRRQRG